MPSWLRFVPLPDALVVFLIALLFFGPRGLRDLWSLRRRRGPF